MVDEWRCMWLECEWCMQVFRRVEMREVEGLTSGGSLLLVGLALLSHLWVDPCVCLRSVHACAWVHRCGVNGSHVGHLVIIVGWVRQVRMARRLAMKVVVLLQLPGQTKESARRDDHMFLLVGCGPYVSIVWGSAICFYYAALGHMFLLCGARPYVSIMRR